MVEWDIAKLGVGGDKWRSENSIAGQSGDFVGETWGGEVGWLWGGGGELTRCDYWLA